MSVRISSWSNRSLPMAVAFSLVAVSLLAVAPGVAVAAPAPPGTVVGWGENWASQANVPPGLADAVAVSAGSAHSLVLRSNGTVVAWGYNGDGQANVPSGLDDATQVSAGSYHSLALRSNGTVVGWGYNDYGQANPPAGLNDAIAVSAGGYHSLALRSNGTVVGWGSNDYGQANPPAALSDVIEVSAGNSHSLALRANGTVVAWGYNYNGQANVPAGLSNVAAISAGPNHNLALKSDGTVVGWGSNDYSQANPPFGLSDVIAVSAGNSHSLALRANGTVVAWGYNGSGQTDVPSGLSDVTAISAGGSHNLALTGVSPSAPTEFSITKDVAARTATIHWQPPVSNGSSSITGYRVARDAGTLPGQKPWSTVVAASARSHLFKFLTRGSTYTLTVQAINAVGVGTAAKGTVTISDYVPSVPTSFSITKVDSSQTATIHWQPPVSNGSSAITGYLVARDAGTLPGQKPWSTVVAASARSHLFKFLTRGSTYTLWVQAINAVGSGPAVSGTVKISDAVPAAPTAFSVSTDPAAGTATISWQPPPPSGTSAVTGYFVSRDAGTVPGRNAWSKMVGGATRSFTFTNLIRGSTYAVSVQAVNATGPGPAASGSATIGAGAANRLRNPGFERDSNRDGRPDMWSSTAKFSRSRAVVYSGRFSGRLRANNDSRQTISQVVPSLSSGTGYQFSGRVDIPATTDRFTFMVRVKWLNRSGKVLRTDVVQAFTTSTGGWVEARGTFASPIRAARARVQMTAKSLNAAIYVDAFTLSQL